MDSRLNSFVARLQVAFAGELWGAVLFGSRARGDAGPSSDYDLFLIIDSLPQRPLERQESIVQKTGGTHGFNIIARTRAEVESVFPSLYLDIGQDGVVLLDRDGYTAAKLELIRKFTKQAGLTRERLARGFDWCWRRKPGRDWHIGWDGVRGTG